MPIKTSAGDSSDELPEIQKKLLIFEWGMFPPKAITNIPHAMKSLCSRSTTAWKVNPTLILPLILKVEGHSGGEQNEGTEKSSKPSFPKGPEILEVKKKCRLDKLTICPSDWIRNAQQL